MLENSSTIKVGDSDKLKATINSYLQQLGVDVSDDMEAAIKEVGKEAVKQLKATSPRRTVGKTSKKGHYANGWRFKYQRKKNVITSKVYNATKPGLAHLLEHEHERVDRTGASHGYSSPKVHIDPVAQWVDSELPRRISQKISQSK